MAKSRTRGAAPGAPKPKIEPRKVPLTKRTPFRWGAVVAGALIVLWIVMVVLGAMGRSNAIRVYDDDLQEALQPFTSHREASAAKSFQTMPAGFTSGTVGPADLAEAAALWQTDFGKAAGQVRALEPPEQLTDAQETLARSLDLYAVVAELYAGVADLKSLSARVKGKEKQGVEAQVATLTQKIEKVRAQADALYGDAFARIDELKVAWGVAPAQAPPTGLPTGLGGIPGG